MTTNELAENSLIYKVRVGSWAYGTALDTSDEDFAGVFIPPIEYYFGLQAFDLLNESKEEDKAYYSLRKFANLAIANNPNVLELLFVHPDDVRLMTPFFLPIKENRDLFLSQKCRDTYVGYASAQLHRIRNHRKWLTQELAAVEVLWPLVVSSKISEAWVQWKFGSNLVERIEAEFEKEYDRLIASGEPKGQLNGAYSFWRAMPKDACMDTYMTDLNDAARKKLKSSTTGLEEPDEEDEQFYHTSGDGRYVFDQMKYKEVKKQRHQYIEWMAARNKSRHEDEVVFGYDCKHAMHLIRLLRSGYEILTTGVVNVRRPDAEELLAIRKGSLTYDQVVSYADEMIVKFKEINKFAVPETPDVQKIDRLVIEATKEALRERKV